MVRKPRAQPAREAEPPEDWLEDRLEGTYWDGADKDMRRVLGRLRWLMERELVVEALVRDLPEVRRSKTRPRQLDTALAKGFGQAMLNLGYTSKQVGAVCREFLRLQGRTPGAAEKAVKRQRQAGPKRDKLMR
jgi:hypothetical protein